MTESNKENIQKAIEHLKTLLKEDTYKVMRSDIIVEHEAHQRDPYLDVVVRKSVGHLVIRVEFC